MPVYTHITVLSNWLVGYDRYQRIYTKSTIKNSTYPDKFFLLTPNNIIAGETKATRLLHKLNIQNDQLIRIDTELPADQARLNDQTGTGVGWYINDHKIPVTRVHLQREGNWEEVTIEEATALAFQLHPDMFSTYQELKPLTFSFLPIAIACQAACKFCFSGSSISIERKRRIQDFTDLDYWMERAANAGAERFVITGGGEPTIMPFEEIEEALRKAQPHYRKSILITNGIFLSKHDSTIIAERLRALRTAGLDVLSFSYHHHTREGVKQIMGLDTGVEEVLAVWQTLPKEEVPTVRLICVLQQGGVEDAASIEAYLQLARKYEVPQVCFKELYVSATTESLYSSGKENIYSRDHQVSLSILLNWFDQQNTIKIGELPWGAPIHAVTIDGHTISVAAYTEPSVGWERSSGIARSWNYMADKRCFASLEDEASELVKA